MSDDMSERTRIYLAGDWSMDGVTKQMPQLVEQLASLSGICTDEKLPTNAHHDQSEVDLTRIEKLDACGCQLLAVFLRALQLGGIKPLLNDMPDDIKEKIQFLGFANELELQSDHPRKCA